MNLGIRAHDIENRSLEELVSEIVNKGLTSVQFAVSKSLPSIPPETGRLSPGLARYIGSAFQRKNIQIAVLGCYINMIHPDQSERRQGLEWFKEHIRFARDFGCSIVGTETGNVNAEITYNVKNFEEQPFTDVVKSVCELVEEAEQFGVIVGIEAGVNHPVNSAEKLKKLINTVNSNNLQVILDPVNLLTVENYTNQEDIIKEAIELLGDRIVILHAKDFTIRDNRLITVPIGQGLLNYETIFSLIKTRKPYLNILMEETKEPFIDDSIRFLKEKYQQDL